ncbi:glycosyltransferase [Mucilaginibacter boryungensis]|uniref:Glycosyltransferase n=1 Tax=Mucilaginibacter boryungensis TaxID=768480 RepID=A0ABR9XF36_9SPHI|nr:glycosyltransferase [Mucilaginibacter boryungensis]MBE9665999.1 glycosyltransferase [Mucilaginibacter boryungensis]
MEIINPLPAYREAFIIKGVQLPLMQVPYKHTGLLAELPVNNINIGWPWQTEVDPAAYLAEINWPKLTIVIPSFNQGKFIEHAIRSVLLQNYPHVELIIMDGGSTDETNNILNKYAKWISYTQNEKDNGQGHGINLGFSMASGSYYGWLNSDDFYNQNAFLVLATEILKSGKDFYYGDGLTVNEDNSIQTYWQAHLVWDMFLRYGGLIASHSAFWKNKVHQPIWEKMNCNVDGELWLRLVKGVSKKHIRFALGSIRQHGDTKSANDGFNSKWQQDDQNIESIYGKPPGMHSAKTYFYRFVQNLFTFYNKLLR